MSQSTRIHRSEVNFFPPCLDDLVDSNNPVRALDFYVEGLDLEALGFELKGKCELGRPVDYSGKDLLKLLIYGYLNQVRSCRKLAVETTRNLEVIWMLENARPKYWTINQFRKDNRTAFKNVLRNFHQVCEQLELFGKELLAIDGAFFKARNNSSRNYTEAKLDKMGAKIDAAIDAYDKAIEEDDKTGGTQPSDSEPETATATTVTVTPSCSGQGDQLEEPPQKDLLGEDISEPQAEATETALDKSA